MNIASAWAYSVSDAGNGMCNLILRVNAGQLGIREEFTDISLRDIPPLQATAIISWWAAIGMFMTEYCAHQFLAGVKYGMDNSQGIGIEIIEDDDE